MSDQTLTNSDAIADQASTRTSRGISRRELLTCGAILGLAPLAAFADTYPNRPVVIIVGAPPGGVLDIAARIISLQLGELLGVSVVVEYRPGATGVIGTKFVAKASPDGYTLLIGSPNAMIFGPQTMPTGPFNPFKNGVVGINMIVRSSMTIAVRPSLKINNLTELVKLSKTRPVTIGIAGLGGATDLMLKRLSKLGGGEFQAIPYTGMGPAITDVLGGQIDGAASDMAPFIPFSESRKIKIVAVVSQERAASLPDVGTVDEVYPGFYMHSWVGFFAPTGTPQNILNKVSDALRKVILRDDVKALFKQSGSLTSAMETPAEFQQFVKNEFDQTGKLLREFGVIKS